MLLRIDFSALGMGHYIATDMLTTCDMKAWRFYWEIPMSVSLNAAGEQLASAEICDAWEEQQRLYSRRID